MSGKIFVLISYIPSYTLFIFKPLFKKCFGPQTLLFLKKKKTKISNLKSPKHGYFFTYFFKDNIAHKLGFFTGMFAMTIKWTNVDFLDYFSKDLKRH